MLIFDQLKKNDPPMRVLTLSVLVGLFILFSGLWYVQIISAKRFKETERAQSFRTVRLPAQRGRILDRNGQVLADNRPSFNVNLYLKDLRKNFQDTYSATVKAEAARRGVKRLPFKDRTLIGQSSRYHVVSNFLHQLTPALGQELQLSFAKFNSHFEKQPALPLPIMPNLGPAQVARFLEKPDRPPGFNLEIQPLRHYTNGLLASHVIGYVRKGELAESENEIAYSFRLPDYLGELGMELKYDEFLRGKPGVKSVQINSLGYAESENIFPHSETGRDIVLTLDLGIQRVVEKALREKGFNRGAAVVMDVRTGDLYAMASMPAFDPNIWLDGLTQKEWDSLSDKVMRPLRNRATQEHYAPGSIFKIISGLAALEVGVMDPNAKIRTEAKYTKYNLDIKDTAAPGDYDFIRAFKRSSNYYFIHYGIKEGVVQKMAELGEKLHLNERFGLFPLQEAAGDFPSRDEVSKGWVLGETAHLSIGQGRVAVTPLQMAVMTAAIANGGKVLWPRIVDRIEAGKDSVDEKPIYFQGGRVRDVLGVNPKHLSLIRRAMLADVEDRGEEGTGAAAYIEGMGICGKTGTAEVEVPGKPKDHITWFVSFAPYDNPRYAVVVMVESGASGGLTCAPIAKQIYLEIRERELRLQTTKVAKNDAPLMEVKQ